jgi:hypothetical protein
MVIDIYGVPSNGKQTKLLVLQDNLDDSGNRSTEGKQALEYFRQLSKLEPQSAYRSDTQQRNLCRAGLSWSR